VTSVVHGHASCENISDDVYDSMNTVLGSINNFVYYCEGNTCISKIKQLLFIFFIGDSADLTRDNSDKPSELQTLIVKQQNCLSKQLDDLTQRIADLTNKHQSLQCSVQSTSSQFADLTTNMETDAST